MDTAGGDVTHIIPLYQDRNGNYYIVFWKVETCDSLTIPTAWTFSFNMATCEGTFTPTLTTYNWRVDVTDPSIRDTGLTLTIGLGECASGASTSGFSSGFSSGFA